jgi:hypothetical protein
MFHLVRYNFTFDDEFQNVCNDGRSVLALGHCECDDERQIAQLATDVWHDWRANQIVDSLRRIGNAKMNFRNVCIPSSDVFDFCVVGEEESVCASHSTVIY